MSKLRITTWNINSVRLRVNILARVLEAKNPDVICLQEIKCVDDCFPLKALENLGYAHQHIHGMKSYNGVAILSRTPLTDTQIFNRVGKEDRRHIAAVHAASGVEIHNLYVPAGGDIPDTELNDKFAHKLDFVDELAAWSASLDQTVPRILVGDFNIAPEEHDVWSHKQLLDVVSHTPVEVEKLRAWQAAGNWIDAARHFTPLDQKLYSWWSYRNNDWAVSNRGRRLDHMWVSPGLKGSLVAIEHDSAVRDWTHEADGKVAGPSDHIPVTLDLEINRKNRK